MANWKEYLTETNEMKYNVSRLDSMEDLNTNCVLNYVMRCLEIAEKDMRNFDITGRKLVIRTLQWMDVAKCGSESDRRRWKALIPSICLDVHTEASAEIYKTQSPPEDDTRTREIVYTLIRTHGLIGQYIMGECDLNAYKELATLNIDKALLFKVLKVINHAVMAGVSKELWKKNQVRVNTLLTTIVNGIYQKESVETRLRKLFPAFKYADISKEELSLYTEVFEAASMWYPTPALCDFNKAEINTIFTMIRNTGLANVKHIDFYNLMRELSYDRNGTRTLNIYKKRILEVALREMAEGSRSTEEHVSIKCIKEGNCVKFMVEFTPVCAALINFCVEAERSGFASYQKNIITIFDMFGFRRDIFDRLTNEEDYLNTMNNAKESTKLDILQYIEGDSIVDVGSGGGVLLDEISRIYPEKQLAGTDISQNVIEHLTDKIRKENRTYTVFKHNFTTQRLWTPVNNIVFSAIIHEIYSYTETDGRKFNMRSVTNALTNAYHSLTPDGRIIIRDGVMTDSDRIVTVEIVDEDMFNLATSYLKDFQGLTYLKDNGVWRHTEVEGHKITAPINLIREMLYTITWGPVSYPQEVQEQFGYLTLREYNHMLETLGYNVIHSEEVIEAGYEEHLKDKVKLVDFKWSDIPTNCIIIATK